MVPYKNLSGDSGVKSYDIGPDFIVIQYATGGKFKYTFATAGRGNVEQMQLLAEAGRGLHAFVNETPGVSIGYVRPLGF